MKKFNFTLFMVLFILSGWTSFAQEIALTEDRNPSFEILQNDYSTLRVQASIAKLNSFQVKTLEGVFQQLMAEGYAFSNRIGEPQLPVLKKLIEVPANAAFEIEVIPTGLLEIDLSDYKILNSIIPTQPPVSKSIDNPGDLPFEINQIVYQTDAFTGQEIALIEYMGTMRGISLARLEIAPLKYNPVKNIIQVYTQVEVKIIFTGAIQSQIEKQKQQLFSPYFEGAFSLISNYKPIETDELIMVEPVTYIIVSDPMFQAALQPFIQWKTKKGFKVVEGYTNNPAVGNTTTSIKNYLQNFYNNPPPGYHPQSFVLFVGDVAQIPAFTGTAGSHITDLYYCEYTGDKFPECYYGRFSANNLTELQPQIDKTLQYEQYLMPDPSFLDKVVMVAGADGTYGQLHGNGQINYGTTQYFNAAHGLYSYTYLQPEPSGANYSANIRQNVSNGVAFANYTAHCSSNGWADPSFNISHISALTNANKYPLMIGNCCLSVTFGGTCFGEEVLRAPNKGALGYIGGSNNTYWNEDFWWGVGYKTVTVNPSYSATNLGAYDRLFHDHGEPLSQWYITQGQIPTAGNLAVTQAGSSLTNYYWEIYHLMGDPSLMVYFSQPPQTTATYPGLMPLNTVSFVVNTQPWAYVSISKDGVLHGAALADATGTATVSLIPITVPGIADVVVTRQNGQPFTGTVSVASPSGPYLMLKEFSIDDAAGNNNQAADYGETLLLNVSLENLGSQIATNVSAVLMSFNPFITILDNNNTWPDIPAGTISTANGAFSLTIAANVPDQQVAAFELEITNGIDIWTSSFNITIQAPALQFGNLVINDNIGGNGNGRLDPGETAEIIVDVFNNGNSLSPSGSSTLTTGSTWISMNIGTVPISQISAGGQTSVIFSVTASPSTPVGTAIDLNVDVNAGNYGINHTFYRMVGLVLEDWETGNFASFPWTFGGNAPWTITSISPYEGIYSAKSGTITHNQTTDLIVELYVSQTDQISFFRKVSSESGYDYLRFFIDGVQKAQWAGDVAWGEVSFPVTSGLRTFMWRYYKDGSVSTGSDCAWIDYIVFPSIIPPPDPPEIVLNPLSFEVSLPLDADEIKLLTIGNTGEELLQYSVSKQYQLPVKKDYCAASGGGDEYISQVIFNTINNTSGSSYYAYYPAIPTTVDAGQSYNLTVFIGNYYSVDDIGVWVDWNQDGDFDDPGENVVCQYSVNNPATYTITVPEDALPGETRMRIRLKYSGNDCGSSCGSTTYGEVEDYTLLINSNSVDWLTLDTTSGTVPGSGTTNVNLTFNSTGLEVGTYYANVIVTSNDPVTPTVIIPCTLHAVEELVVDLKVFLEGPFAGTEMTTLLNQSGQLPLTQPYNTSPWNYPGTENAAVIPSPNVVDWMLLDFRDAPLGASSATPATTVERRAAFVLNDGSIVDMDGVSPVLMTEPIVNELFVVVHHRNHIPIMSSMQVPRTGNVYFYDFTDGAGKVYGGSSGYNEITPGIWGLVSGDGLCDGVVDATDKTAVWNPEAGHSGYHNGDMNLDGQISNSDKSEHWLPNMGKTSQVPE